MKITSWVFVAVAAFSVVMPAGGDEVVPLWKGDEVKWPDHLKPNKKGEGLFDMTLSDGAVITVRFHEKTVRPYGLRVIGENGPLLIWGSQMHAEARAFLAPYGVLQDDEQAGAAWLQEQGVNAAARQDYEAKVAALQAEREARAKEVSRAAEIERLHREAAFAKADAEVARKKEEEWRQQQAAQQEERRTKAMETIANELIMRRLEGR